MKRIEKQKRKKSGWKQKRFGGLKMESGLHVFWKRREVVNNAV